MYGLEAEKAWDFADEMRTQNRKLCGILEFYANENNYVRGSNGESIVDDDGGYRAKLVLEAINSDEDEDDED